MIDFFYYFPCCTKKNGKNHLIFSFFGNFKAAIATLGVQETNKQIPLNHD